ncbi:MAG: ABC transporter permease [Bacteroidales bacterium]
MSIQPKLKETVYSQQLMRKGLISFFLDIFKDFRDGHNLGKQLFVRDTKALYRQSFLGLIWAFIPPIITAVLWIFLNNSRVITVEVTGMSYALFAVIGTFLWQVVTLSITTTLNTVNSGKPLLTKLNFPRESLLIHAFYTILFNTGILFLITTVIALTVGWVPSWSFLLFPFVLLALVLVGFVIGLLSLTIFGIIADFSRIIPIALQLLMYVSAVIFPTPKGDGLAATIFQLNPFTYLITFCRSFFVHLPLEHDFGFFVILIVTLFLLLVGLFIYRITMPIVIERLGS